MVRLEGQGDQLERIVFADGTHLAHRAVFIQPAATQHSDLLAQVGCNLSLHSGHVQGAHPVRVYPAPAQGVLPVQDRI